MSHEFDRARRLFLTATDITNPADRADYLRRECGGDPAVRAAVEALLRHYRDGDPFLETPAFTPGVAPALAADAPGGRVGVYELIRPLGEGGMGTVWLAEQHEPIPRQVAVKLIRAGAADPQLAQRLRTEGHTLALMDHPNIARVLDGGVAPDGRPFLVMEVVPGVPLTTYCRDRRLAVPARLGLFADVCRAVHHAHQKGVIHRDLKPSNVLVADGDGGPVPKVIDFGISKAAGLKLAGHALQTEHGAVIGTPEYMAPEQADLSGRPVDTRADVYALGVLLYELLTGTTPLDRAELAATPLAEVLRRIREDDPPRPSSRLGGPGGAAAGVAGHTPTSLARVVRGELDWITAKALEKDPARRYESAAALARDVDRYLCHEPVEAGPPSATYRLRKFARRHRGPVLAAGLVLVALVGGAAGTAWGLVQARAAGRRETERADGEREAKELAVRRLAQVERGAKLLADLFHDINPDTTGKDAPGLADRLADRLTAAAGQVDAVGDPLVAAGVLTDLAAALADLGFPDRAVPPLERVRAARTDLLGPGHPDTLRATEWLARAHRLAGRPAVALPLLEAARPVRLAVSGADHPDALHSLAILGATYCDLGRDADALPLFEQVNRGWRAAADPDPVQATSAVTNLGAAYYGLGRTAEAIGVMEAGRPLAESRLGAAHPHVLVLQANLANVYMAVGRHADAARLFERTLPAQKAKLGDTHPEVLTTLSNLAIAYRRTNRPADALPLLLQSRAGWLARGTPDVPAALAAANNLAVLYGELGRKADALPLLEEVVARRAVSPGPGHPDTMLSGFNVACAYQDLGRLAEAARECDRWLPHARALRPDHPVRTRGLGWVAGIYTAAGRPDDGIEVRRLIVAHTPPGPRRVTALAEVGRALERAGRPAEAVPVLREAVAGAADNWRRAAAQSLLGLALLRLGQVAEGGPLIRDGYEGLVRHKATIPSDYRPVVAEAADRLITLAVRTGDGLPAARAERAKYPPEQAPWPRRAP